jgi:hypothetical protein
VRSELLKLKGSWLLPLSFLLPPFFALLALVLNLAGSQAALSAEPLFLMLLRQNHIFLSLLTGNLLFTLIATDLFFKEFQLRTVNDIIAVPVPRIRFILAKEIVLFLWTMCIGILSFLVCLIIAVFFPDRGFSPGTAVAGLWRYVCAAAIQFIPLQLGVWITLVFRSYIVSLGLGIAAIVGSVIAFNTKEAIFLYPYSIGFVLTNFKTPPTPSQLTASLCVLGAMAAVCSAGIALRIRRMDI